MKKVLFSLLMMAGAVTLFAQDNYNNTSTGTYNAYSVPNYVLMDFQNHNPGITDVTWDASNPDWYHSYYVRNGYYTNLYYSRDPYYNVLYYPERVTGFKVSLPVTETYVPDAVLVKASDMYKNNLYDITALKDANKNDVYQVRIMSNGQLQTMWMDANGGTVADVYRSDDMNNTQPAMTTTTTNTTTVTSTSTSSNAAMDNSTISKKKIKTKTTTADGKKVITKTKKGRTKTWTVDNNNDNQ